MNAYNKYLVSVRYDFGCSTPVPLLVCLIGGCKVSFTDLGILHTSPFLEVDKSESKGGMRKNILQPHQHP